MRMLYYVLLLGQLLLSACTRVNARLRGTSINYKSFPPREASRRSRSLSPADLPDIRQRLNIHHLYTFGDSFSDTGNVFAASNDTSPSPKFYYEGRYSNGRNLVDFIVELLQIENFTTTTIATAGNSSSSSSSSANYAWGGATTNNDYLSGYSTFLNGPVPSVNVQIETYLDDVAQQQSAADMEETLFTVWSGYNDYWWFVYNQQQGNETQAALTNDTVLEQVADRVTAEQINNIQSLIVRGGAKRILVLDLPDMTRYPDAVTKTPNEIYAYGKLTAYHNALLKQKMQPYLDYSWRHHYVRLFSAFDLYQTLMNHAEWYGYTTTSQAPCLANSIRLCSDPYSHFFLDDWHALTQTQHRIAHAVLGYLLQ